MRVWYWYKLGGWEIAVDAVSRRDADNHIRIHARGAKFQGEAYPPISPNWSTATAMVTTKRQELISATIRRENGED